MFSKSLVILLAAFSCVNALATPHHVRSSHHHRAIAHAARAPVARNVSGVAPPSKRSLRKRCRNRPVTSSLVQANFATSSSSAAAAPTTSSTQVEAQPTSTTEQAPPPPTTTSSTQAEPTSTTEQAPPPATTSSTQEQQQPTTSTQEQQQPTTTSQEQSQPTQGNDNSGNSGNNSGGPSFLSGTQTGEATFYNTGLTACGTTKSDSDAIVAVSQLLFDVFPGANGNPNLNPICGKKVRATYQGKSVDLEIQDRCVGCAITDLDMTPTAFEKLADLGVGRLQGMTWVWI